MIIVALAVSIIVNIRMTLVPELELVEPSIGSPGDVIFLRGQHFGTLRNNGFVEIGGERLTASSYLAWSDTEIKLLLPSNVQEGLVIVDISGRRSQPKVFTNENTIPVAVPQTLLSKKPSIDSLSANSLGVGQLLVISGSNFGEIRKDSKVLFKVERELRDSEEFRISADSSEFIEGNVDDFDYESWSDKEIKVRIPDGAVSGNVFVQTEKGRSSPKNLKIVSCGAKQYFNDKTYLVRVKTDISNVAATSASSFTLHIPRPELSATQPVIEMTECMPKPLLENYHNSVIQHAEFRSVKEEPLEFKQDFMIKVFEISCRINREQVRPFSDRQRPLFVEYTKPNVYEPSDNPEIVKLGAAIVKKERNPYVQANLVYNYLLKNFTLLQFSRNGDFNFEQVSAEKAADSYDFAIMFTSILRSLKIPAKTLSGVLVDAELKTRSHWWNEFYIENFGWVPVDLALANGLEYNSFHAVENKKDYYFGNLDSQHIMFSSGWDIVKPSLTNSKIVYRPRSYSLQNIWEEASAETDSYSSFWNVPEVLGLY